MGIYLQLILIFIGMKENIHVTIKGIIADE